MTAVVRSTASENRQPENRQAVRRELGDPPIYFCGSRYASSIGELGIAARPRWEALAYFLTHEAAGAGPFETFYENVQRVGADETVDFSVEPARRTRAPVSVADDAWFGCGEQELVSALRTTIEDSVRRAVGDGRRIAVLTGGGLDSGALLGAVVAHARGATKREATAIALHFAGPGDDRPYLSALCKDLGVSPILVRPSEPATWLSRALVVDGIPTTYPTVAFELHALELAHAHGFDVLLDGIFGDQIFDGNPVACARMAVSGNPWGGISTALRLVHRHDLAPQQRLWRHLAYPLLRELVPSNMRRATRSHRAQKPWMSRRLREWTREFVRTDEIHSSILTSTAPERYRDHIRSYRIDTAAEWRHASGRLFGVRRRDPYADARVVQFVSSLPPEKLLSGGWIRGLFRRAVEGWIPGVLQWRRSKAWLEPAVNDLIGARSAMDQLRPFLTFEALADMGFVDPRKLRSAHEKDVQTDVVGWYTSWSALAAEALVRTMNTNDDGAYRALD